MTRGVVWSKKSLVDKKTRTTSPRIRSGGVEFHKGQRGKEFGFAYLRGRFTFNRERKKPNTGQIKFAEGGQCWVRAGGGRERRRTLQPDLGEP